MKEIDVLLDIKNRITSTLKKWDKETDWFYFKDIVSIDTLKPNRFRIWIGVKTNDKDFLVPMSFHYTKGIDVQDITWRATQVADFSSKKIVLEGIEKIMKEVNRETAINRFIYKKYLEENHEKIYN